MLKLELYLYPGTQRGSSSFQRRVWFLNSGIGKRDIFYRTGRGWGEKRREERKGILTSDILSPLLRSGVLLDQDFILIISLNLNNFFRGSVSKHSSKRR